MQILLKSPDHARHIGKRLAKVLPVRLTRGYVFAAQVLGYRSWDDLLQRCTWEDGLSSSLFAWPDSLCMPAAVKARRAFQAATLARCAGIDQARASEIVEEVKPSDGFHRDDDGWGPQTPRLHDPSLQLEVYHHLLSELHTAWQTCGMRSRLNEALREMWFALETVQLVEWPADQFGETVGHLNKGLSRWYLAPLRQAKKWIGPAEYQACRERLEAVRDRVASAGAQGLEHDIGRFNRHAAKVLKYLDRWREASLVHDGKPVAFVGTQPIEFQAEAMIAEHLDISSNDGLRELSDPDIAPGRARTLLARIEELPEDVREAKPMRFARQKIERALAKADRHRQLALSKLEPLSRSWDLWMIDASGAASRVGTQVGVTSLDALRAGPAAIGGRIVAVPVGTLLPEATKRSQATQAQEVSA